jgi:hypothetical protein
LNSLVKLGTGQLFSHIAFLTGYRDHIGAIRAW